MEFVAVYDKIKFPITVNKTGNSTVTVTGVTGSTPITEIEYGDSYKIALTTPDGEDVKVFTINGVDKLSEIKSSGFVTITNVTANQVIVVSSDAKEYTVKFYRKDATTLIESKTVKHGGTATPPTPPAETGYTFREWIEK